MRRAKIVCTLGPASDDPETIADMIRAGMNVARLNFSHGTHEDHKDLYDTVRDVSTDLGEPVSILQDLQGPKIRTGTFKDGPVMLEPEDEFTITTRDVEGTASEVSTTYAGLPRDVEAGDTILVDDGMIRLEVLEAGETDVRTRVKVGGPVTNHKGINLPTASVSAPSLTDKDVRDLKYGIELGVDYVALSFVRSALDIHQLQSLLPDDEEYPTKLIAKIEKPQAIAELDDIIAVADGIMIARGDLGVELPPQKVPMLQKMAIRKANQVGRLSITATQMLETMTENPRPTRAEASDVANAILDGTDAVMLSGETAAGDYPVESVRMMADIVEEVESEDSPRGVSRPEFIDHLETFPNAVARSATVAADDLDVSGIVCLTWSGTTARLLMTYRPEKSIIACTPNERVYHQLAMYWGVEPFQVEIVDSTDRALKRVEDLMLERKNAESGDELIVVMGSPTSQKSETNLIKFHRMP
jgi:pyruvate kinase